jgi:hypothetical protein
MSDISALFPQKTFLVSKVVLRTGQAKLLTQLNSKLPKARSGAQSFAQHLVSRILIA